MIHCANYRTHLHDWFDSKGAQEMPPEVSEHVRDCAHCRTFIKRWNSIELGFQSIGDLQVTPTSSFEEALRERLAREAAVRRFRVPVPILPPLPIGRWAAAAAAIILIALAIRYSGSARSFFLPEGRAIAGASRNRSQNAEPLKSAIPPDLPIANTR